MRNIATVILAAGKGTRMNHDLPKALIPVGGIPMIVREVVAIEAAGFAMKPIIVVGHKGKLIQEVVGDRARYVVQSRLLGTGHAVRAAEPLFKGKAGDIVVLYADSPLVSSKTLRQLVTLRRKTKAVMSLVTISAPNFFGPRRVFKKYGHIVRDSSGKYLQRCVEYKNATHAERAIKEVNSGFYCFEAKWLWQTLPKLKKKPISGEYYLTDLMGLAVSQGKRVAPLALRNWREGLGANTLQDIRTIERLIQK